MDEKSGAVRGRLGAQCLHRRSVRILGAFPDFSRGNRRMHNKSFIADNQVTIVGGRNIGNEYFGAHGEINFGDLDVATVGPVVREVSHSFDLCQSRTAPPA